VPALSFNARFADLVESGQKTQTIRAPRKRPIICSDRLYLYTGMRTKGCRKLGEGLVERVELIRLDRRGCSAGEEHPHPMRGAGIHLSWHAVDRLALADGFTGSRDMLDWFEKTHGLPFTGSLIRWRLLQRAAWLREAT
jgi:hypothetical protein